MSQNKCKASSCTEPRNTHLSKQLSKKKKQVGKKPKQPDENSVVGVGVGGDKQPDEITGGKKNQQSGETGGGGESQLPGLNRWTKKSTIRRNKWRKNKQLGKKKQTAGLKKWGGGDTKTRWNRWGKKNEEPSKMCGEKQTTGRNMFACQETFNQLTKAGNKLLTSQDSIKREHRADHLMVYGVFQFNLTSSLF